MFMATDRTLTVLAGVSKIRTFTCTTEVSPEVSACATIMTWVWLALVLTWAPHLHTQQRDGYRGHLFHVFIWQNPFTIDDNVLSATYE
jgi:hypothetical protein